MDLKDVIEDVCSKAGEAHSAFHAGHKDNAKGYLRGVVHTIEDYFVKEKPPAGDVTESATSEKPAESLEETQAKVSGPGVHPAVIDPAAAARTIGSGPKDEKPTQ